VSAARITERAQTRDITGPTVDGDGVLVLLMADVTTPLSELSAMGGAGAAPKSHRLCREAYKNQNFNLSVPLVQSSPSRL